MGKAAGAGADMNERLKKLAVQAGLEFNDNEVARCDEVDLERFAELVCQDERETYGYAKRLAEFIWEKHYKKESPDWTPLPDVLGVLTQIDNMTCGLEKAKPEMPTKIFGPNLEQILNAAGFYRREWVGLTDDEIKEVLGLNETSWSLSGIALQHVMDDARALEAKLKEKNGG